jgi:hypothetical protein
VVWRAGAGSSDEAGSPTPPLITTQPQNQTVVAGQNATFSVSASGTAPLAYQWRFHGTNLSGATASSFTRTNVLPEHAGPYSVLVSNVAGSVTSSNALLTVLGRIAGQLQLQGFVGTTRLVTFVISDEAGIPLQTNELALSFAGSPRTADFELTAPLNAARLSAKTAWHLRRRQPVLFSNGMATNLFTGPSAQLLGGDISGNNNLVNTADYTVLKANWLKTNAAADITGDGLVNTADYTILKANWLKAGDPP